MKSMNEIENIKVTIRARSGQKLDQCVVKNFRDDCLQSEGRGVFVFLLGDNNIRDHSGFTQDRFMNLYQDIFSWVKQNLPDGTLIVNGILPHPGHTWFDRRAKNIDRKIRVVAQNYNNIETVDLEEKIFQIEGKRPRSLYQGDQVHLSHHGEKIMGPLLAAQCKAAVCFQRMKMRPCHFGLFDQKPKPSTFSEPNMGFVDEPVHSGLIRIHPDPHWRNAANYANSYSAALLRNRKVEWTPTWFPKEKPNEGHDSYPKFKPVIVHHDQDISQRLRQSFGAGKVQWTPTRFPKEKPFQNDSDSEMDQAKKTLPKPMGNNRVERPKYRYYQA